MTHDKIGRFVPHFPNAACHYQCILQGTTIFRSIFLKPKIFFHQTFLNIFQISWQKEFNLSHCFALTFLASSASSQDLSATRPKQKRLIAILGNSGTIISSISGRSRNKEGVHQVGQRQQWFYYQGYA